MPITTPDEKFAYELGGVYDAEHHFLQALQELAVRASDNTLKDMLQMHIGQTQQQIHNLEQVFQQLGRPAERVTCAAAAGLVTDGWKALQEADGNPQLIDGLILGAQAKVEHLEIASYRGLVTAAELMGQQEVLQLLQQNLQQEELTAQGIEQHARVLLQLLLQTQPAG